MQSNLMDKAAQISLTRIVSADLKHVEFNIKLVCISGRGEGEEESEEGK